MHGEGKEYRVDGTVVHGTWKHGKPQGQQVVRDEEGTPLGTLLDGEYTPASVKETESRVRAHEEAMTRKNKEEAAARRARRLAAEEARQAREEATSPSVTGPSHRAPRRRTPKTPRSTARYATEAEEGKAAVHAHAASLRAAEKARVAHLEDLQVKQQVGWAIQYE